MDSPESKPDSGASDQHGTKPSLRRIRPEDESALATLFQDNDLPEVVLYFDPFPLNAESARHVAHHDGADLYWGIWISDRLVGMSMARGREAGHTAPMIGALVDHQYSGKRVFPDVAAQMIADLLAEGITVVRGKIHDTNEASLRFAHRIGAKEVSRAEGRVFVELCLTDLFPPPELDPPEQRRDR